MKKTFVLAALIAISGATFARANCTSDDANLKAEIARMTDPAAKAEAQKELDAAIAACDGKDQTTHDQHFNAAVEKTGKK